MRGMEHVLLMLQGAHSRYEMYTIVFAVYGITGAFRGLIGRAATLEDAYLDGISVTHGSPWARQHIWSSAATTGDEEGNFQPDMLCKCSNANAWPFSTSFIGNDHFCDTGMATSQIWLVSFL